MIENLSGKINDMEPKNTQRHEGIHYGLSFHGEKYDYSC